MQVRVKKITKLNENHKKYDLTIANNHNFYANDILVHNSNFSACHDGSVLWVKSRNFFKKKDPDNQWWEPAIRYDLETKLKKYPMYAFFAELYGQVKNFPYDTQVVTKTMPIFTWLDQVIYTLMTWLHLQKTFQDYFGRLARKKVNSGLKINVRESKLRFFDIYDIKNQKFLPYDEFIRIIDELGLERVPELYRGPWLDQETMYQYAEGKTTLDGKHVREGFVLRSATDRYEPRLGGRLHLKLVGQGYNLQK